MANQSDKSNGREKMKRSPGRHRDPAIDKAILNAALSLFLQHGTAGVNFEQISRSTGIPRATIYRRWKTRRDLLRATINSARTSVVTDVDVVLSMSPAEFRRFLEDTIVAGLMSPIVPKLVAQLIGAFSSHPKLLTHYCRSTIEPGWQAIFAALDRARMAGSIEVPLEPDLLKDVLSGAIIHHLISRSGRPKEEEERAWARRLMRLTGLIG